MNPIPESPWWPKPVTGSRMEHAFSRIPLLRRLKKHPQSYVPPAPVRQVRPVLGKDARLEVTRPVPVDVKVYVAETGKVDYAELISPGNKRHRNIESAAVYAARRWDFVPAHLGEAKVPGEADPGLPLRSGNELEVCALTCGHSLGDLRPVLARSA